MRAERVAKVVEAERAKLGGVLRVFVAAAERRCVEPAATLVREHEVVGAREAVALEEPGERLSDLRDHRDGAALAALRRADALNRVDALHDADCVGIEVDITDAQREHLAHAEAGERGRQDDRTVLRRGGGSLGRGRRVGLRVRRGADERKDLLDAVEVEPLRVVAGAERLDVSGGICGQVERRLARARADSVHDRYDLHGGAPREPTFRHLVPPPLLNRLRRDLVEAECAERRAGRGERASLGVEVDAEVCAEGGPVVAPRRRLPRALVAAMPVPLGGRVRERGGGAARAGDADAAAEVSQLRLEPVLRGTPREVAVGWPAAALRPSGPDPRLGLLPDEAAVGEPCGAAVLRVPGRAALPLAKAQVAADRTVRLGLRRTSPPMPRLVEHRADT